MRPSTDPELSYHSTRSAWLYLSLGAMLFGFFGACVADNPTSRFLALALFGPGFLNAMFLSIVCSCRWQEKIYRCKELAAALSELRRTPTHPPANN